MAFIGYLIPFIDRWMQLTNRLMPLVNRLASQPVRSCKWHLQLPSGIGMWKSWEYIKMFQPDGFRISKLVNHQFFDLCNLNTEKSFTSICPPRSFPILIFSQQQLSISIISKQHMPGSSSSQITIAWRHASRPGCYIPTRIRKTAHWVQNIARICQNAEAFRPSQIHVLG